MCLALESMSKIPTEAHVFLTAPDYASSTFYFQLLISYQPLIIGSAFGKTQRRVFGDPTLRLLESLT
jgi:hypothetical protein